MKGFSSRSLLAMRMEAVRLPVDAGLKVTLKVAEAPGATSRRLDCVTLKSPLCLPDLLKEMPVSLTVPVFRIVKVLTIPLLVVLAVPKLIFEVLETKLLPAGCWTSISGAEIAMRAALLVMDPIEL